MNKNEFKTEFVNDFRKLDKELKPSILDFAIENQIHMKPFMFFMAAMIKETLKIMETEKQFSKEFDQEKLNRFKEAIILFIVNDK